MNLVAFAAFLGLARGACPPAESGYTQVGNNLYKISSGNDGRHDAYDACESGRVGKLATFYNDAKFNELKSVIRKFYLLIKSELGMGGF